MQNLISRSEAQAKGLKQFFTGTPCRRNHIAPRLVSSKHCIACSNDHSKAWYHRNKSDALLSARARKQQRLGVSRLKPTSCECCNRPPSDSRGLLMDHDHSTGKFRGWLCNDCNTAIGKLGDTVERVSRAVAYLERITP